MKIEKYKWHELRNNSDLYCINDNGTYLVYSDYGYKVCNGWAIKDKYYGVIAWREIEPFEVEE